MGSHDNQRDVIIVGTQNKINFQSCAEHSLIKWHVKLEEARKKNAAQRTKCLYCLDLLDAMNIYVYDL